MSRYASRVAACTFLVLVPLVLAQPVSGEDPEPLFTTAMYDDPAEGEEASKGEFLVMHEGEGEMPTQGYFKKHEPGEIAEFHLFVPEGLDPKKRYPLLIVYHGGKDGASGKGLCRGMSRLSTKQHPVIVLSPNMYTLDAYHELLKAGTLPIDTHRVVVYGHSSGGMGVLSAMAEFLRTQGTFKPATLISSSTTASLGRRAYPQVPYVIMAGEKETPEFVKHKLLKNRRATCRRHAVTMQQVIPEVRYIEMRGHGHGGGKTEHRAVIQNLIRALPPAAVEIKLHKVPKDLEALAKAARLADWASVDKEIGRLDESEAWAPKNTYKTLRKRILKALVSWFGDQAKFVASIRKNSKAWEVLRAFQVYDRLVKTAVIFENTPVGDALYEKVAALEASKHWKAELAARSRYYEIVKEAPSEALREALEALRREAPDTEFGRNRTREKLLALRG